MLLKSTRQFPIYSCVPGALCDTNTIYSIQCHPDFLTQHALESPSLPPSGTCADPGAVETCREVWWVDPVGAILISCYIVWSWIFIAQEQMNQMVRMLSLKPYKSCGRVLSSREWKVEDVVEKAGLCVANSYQ